MPRGIYKRKRKKPQYKHPRHYGRNYQPASNRDVSDAMVYSAGGHSVSIEDPPMKDGFPYHPKSKLRKAYMLGRNDVEGHYKYKILKLETDLKDVEARVEKEKLENERIKLNAYMKLSEGASSAAEACARVVMYAMGKG